MKKKQYTTPKIEAIEMGACTLLSDSSEHGYGHGRETACEHGAPKWFCNDD